MIGTSPIVNLPPVYLGPACAVAIQILNIGYQVAHLAARFIERLPGYQCQLGSTQVPTPCQISAPRGTT